MQVFDASSMIHAWDNYPARQFPGLWEWLSEQMQQQRLVMASVALEEVRHKTPDCVQWLQDNGLSQLPIDNAILQAAIQIKALLGIINDRYHAKGVDENDLLIIATAKVHQAELVTDEGRQTTMIEVPAKRKIPAVCAMPQVSVSCLNFIEYIKSSNTVFR